MEHIKRSHNKTLLLYHLVFPAKYRSKIFSEAIDMTIRESCIEMSTWYEIQFVEIGVDKDHVHFLIQSVPKVSVTELVTKIKSITAKAINREHVEIRQHMQGGHIWTSGYYANTVGNYGNADVIKKYVKNQGHEYKELHREQLQLFEGV